MRGKETGDQGQREGLVRRLGGLLVLVETQRQAALRELAVEEWVAEGERITRALYDLVDSFNGSFSAEHGVGQSKRAYLASYRAGPELNLMRSLKNLLDPANILNPGKVI